MNFRLFFLLAVTISILPITSSTSNLASAQSLPNYCSNENGQVVCVIDILSFLEPGSYSPAIAEIPEGASIIFQNTVPEIHTATSTDASPDESPADAGAKVNGIFDTGILGVDAIADPIVMGEAGVFNYYCAVHPDMRGTIIVGDAAISEQTTSENTDNDSTNSQSLEFSTTSTSDKSISGGELPLTKINSVGNSVYIIDGVTPKGGHDAFSYDGSGHKKITGKIQVDFDPVSNTGTITADWTDPKGNQWRYEQTKFGGGNEMYIGETIDGVTQTKLDADPVAINHFEHGTTGAGPTIEPTLFIYLASWGPAEVWKNGQSQGTFETHMMITEGARDVESGKIFQNDGTTPYSPMSPGNSAVNHNTAQLHLVYHTAPAPEMTNNFPPPFEIFEHTMFYDIDVLPPSVIPAQLIEPTVSRVDKSMVATMAPLHQIKQGVEPSDVSCSSGLELIKKNSDGSAKCVKHTTASKLINRGWASQF